MSDEAGRQRYDGDVDALVAKLDPIVASRGRSFVRYDENKLMTKAKVDKEAIFKAHDILNALHDLQPNLAFPKSLWKQAVKALYERHAHEEKWKINASEMDGYIATMTCRCANLCRTVQQACAKNRGTGKSAPKWVQQLPWIARGDAQASASRAATSFVYGWDKDIKQAWRLPATERNKKLREMSARIKVEKDNSIVAVFPGGDTWLVTDITAEEYLATRNSAKSSAADSKLWSGVHVHTNNKIYVARRSDQKGPIVCVKEQGRQLVQVYTHLLKDDDQACWLMSKLAKEYAEGKHRKEDMYAARDDWLRDVAQVGPKEHLQQFS